MNIRTVVLGGCVGLGVFAGSTQAQTSFDPSVYRSRVHGEPTRVFVLGTLHLSTLDESWKPDVLEPLLQRLERFRPDVIAIENLSGQMLSTLWEFRAVYGTTATQYGGPALMMEAAARVGTGLGVADATREVRALLAKWPGAPSAELHRRMAAALAAAGDPNSALIHWWSLDQSERVAKDGINAVLASQLDAFGARVNESALIGARVGVRLGLPRVYPVDSHGDDLFADGEVEVFAREIFNPMVERLNAEPRLRASRTVYDRMRTGEEVLESYRTLNRAEVGRLSADIEWGSMLEHPTRADLGRKRVASWEVRNLRMAANIRETMGRQPGARVLVIVGATHKPWIEAYLGMMSDVEIVDALTALR